MLRPMHKRGWVSLREFADIAKVSYPTALRMKNDGRIAATRVAGIWRVYKDDLNEFLRNRL